jgi:hypothetical protein
MKASSFTIGSVSRTGVVATNPESGLPATLSADGKRSRARISALFSLNPLPYIGRTILELDAIGFATPKKIDDVLIHEDHVTQVQEDALSARFPTEQRFQLSYIFCFNSTAKLKNHFSVCCSRDP